MNNSIQNDNDCMIEPTQWEDTLGALALGRPGNGELAEELLQDPGVEIMRKLIWNSRAGDIAEHLPITTAH